MKCGRIKLDEACIERYWNDRKFSCQQKPGARFSKVPKCFGCISGDIILFVSLKQTRLEARNFEVIFIFIPFATYEKTSFTEKANRSFMNGFSGPKSFRDFRETGARLELLEVWPVLTTVNYHRNREISILLSQWLAQTMLRATDPRCESNGRRENTKRITPLNYGSQHLWTFLTFLKEFTAFVLSPFKLAAELTPKKSTRGRF